MAENSTTANSLRVIPRQNGQIRPQQKKLIWLKFCMRVEGHMTEENTKFYSLERYSLRDTNFLVGVGQSSSPVALTLHRQ